MGRILSAYILPHPPILVPEVGKGEELKAKSTLGAVKRAAAEIGKMKPSTVIVTTPHGPVFQDFVHVSIAPLLYGNLSKFGADNVQFQFDNNISLVNRIVELGAAENISCGGLDEKIARKYKVPKELDHGVTVPLYFISHEYRDFKLIHISIAYLPFMELYRFGTCIAQAVRESNENVVFVASGDLSHKLLPEGPYGFDKSGPEYDRLLVESIKAANPEKLLEMDEGLCESAGECGLRSFIMMFGALDRYKIKTDVYSYEGPFGVGYCVAKVEPGERLESGGLLKEMEAKEKNVVEKIRAEEDPYVSLARIALEAYVNEGRTISVDTGLPTDMLNNRAGVFVSIKKSGQLRGCIGTIQPVRKNIAEEIIYNAISSGTQDPRFDPVQKYELGSLVYSVDVLMKPEAIASMDELDVKKYGVIVRSGMCSGLLLPNLEGIDTPEKQVAIALQKAGIRNDEKYKMERFEVIRHK